MKALEDALADLPPDEAGCRVFGLPSLARILAPTGEIGQVAGSILGERARPVRAILFNKSVVTNWALGWHQDRTICVRERHDVPHYGPWTVKRGMHHVEPPEDLLSRMITIRAHLDSVTESNAPLVVSPSSHLLGRIPVSEVSAAVKACGTQTCLAEAGDLWLYATLILHASDAARRPTSRRVLQVDYSADELPGGLQWLGV